MCAYVRVDVSARARVRTKTKVDDARMMNIKRCRGFFKLNPAEQSAARTSDD